MTQKLYSLEEASELSGLGTDVIKKFLKLKAIVPINNDHKDVRFNSYGMHRLRTISELLDKGFSKIEIIEILDEK